MAGALTLARSRRQLMVLSDRRLSAAIVAGALAIAIYGVGFLDARVGDAPLFLFGVPLVVAAFAYGIAGGAALGLATAGLACAWWLQHDQSGGVAWVVSRTVTCVLMGSVLGWFADSRQALARRIAHHEELSLDLIATANFDGYFTHVNPAFTRMLGYSREEMLARPFLDFVHPDDRASTVAAADVQTQAGREVLNFQNRYQAKDGSFRWLEWSSRPDPHRRTLIAVARDVTDRKRLEEREHRYQERLEQAVAERTEELEAARRETLRKLALAAEYHDDETRRHTGRVGDTAALISRQLGLSEHTVELIREGALLHDVGKVGVMDTVLLKPGRLTSDEFEHVKRHTEIGAAILSGSSSDVLKVAEEIALSHHECWDGSGYPRGLSGESIPLAARIVAVADVFDALTHTRPYKEAVPVLQAVEEIRRLAGSRFDPAVVAAFDRLDAHRLAGLPATRAEVPQRTSVGGGRAQGNNRAPR